MEEMIARAGEMGLLNSECQKQKTHTEDALAHLSPRTRQAYDFITAKFFVLHKDNFIHTHWHWCEKVIIFSNFSEAGIQLTSLFEPVKVPFSSTL